MAASAPGPGVQVAVLLYPGCIHFEVALAAEVLAAGAHIHYLTPEGETHLASHRARILADGAWRELLHRRYDAVLVPGGDPRDVLLPQPRASEGLQRQATHGAWIAGICAGNLVIAAAGLLRGRRGTHNYTPEFAPPEQVATVAPYWEGLRYERAPLVRDGRIITAQPWAYRAYAAELGRVLGVLDDIQADAIEHYVERRTQDMPPRCD